MDAGKALTVYLAGPLFTQAEWLWNEALAKHLCERSLNVILPQHRAEPMLKGTHPFDPKALFQVNVESIEKADVVVAILDGSDADSGTCWECGYAFKAGRPVIGVRSDIRAGGDDPKTSMNLMLAMSCAATICVPYAIRDDVDWVATKIAEAIRQNSSGNSLSQD